ncbi:MAG TPA: DEAD/DEAH box helicase [Candidatus Binatia bacterium]
MLGCAATGSGKTAAFLLPILHQLLENPRRGTRVLILAPTRELASQIVDEVKSFATGTPLRAIAVVGGMGMRPQEQALRAGADIVVATPGRLLDHLRQRNARLERVEHLVLDEADRMLDMGFLPDVRRILSEIPRQRQTLFFSATVPAEIAKLAGEMLHEPVRIGAERKAAPAAGVTQHVYAVSATKKSSLLVALLEQNVVAEALAFTRTKHRADRLAQFLRQNGILADRIHGNRSQNQRTAALSDFKAGRLRVLVATDIAARGIDVSDLSHVINFDLPGGPEDYIHRVGRTGRAAASGDALTFVAPEDESEMKRIERALGHGPIARRKLDGFDYSAQAGNSHPMGEARPQRYPRPSGQRNGQRPSFGRARSY